MNFLKSTAVVSSCTMLSRIFGFIRDIFFAKYLGTGYLADIFLTAFKLPNFFRNIFTEGAFNSSFIPLFSSSLEKEKKEYTNSFARNIFSILMYFMLIITIIAEIFMPQLVTVLAPGFTGEKYTAIIPLSRITFLYLIFISAVSFMSAVLNSYGKFAVVSVTPVILNITFIFFSIISPYINLNIATILSYAVVVGGILQFLWLMFFTVKNGVLLYPIYPVIDDKIKIFFKNFFNSFLGNGIVQINSIINAVIATHIAGAVSFIYYSDRVSQLPLALIGTAISISTLPLLSKKISTNSDDVNKIQEKSVFIALFLGLPCAVALFTLSEIFIPILFERGKFTSSDSLAVISCLKICAFSLPIFIMNKILQTIFYAHKDTKTPMYASLINLIFNVLLNLLFMKYFSYRGIVLATVVSSFINFLILFIILIKRKQISFSMDFTLRSVKMFYSLIFFVLTIALLKKFIPFDDSLIFNIIKFTFICGISGMTYLILAFFLGAISKKFILEN